jgi:peptidoglycan/LPS O-acetylase OafA/YrhL
MFPCILAILLRNAGTAKRFTDAMKPRLWLSVIGLLAAGIALGVIAPEWRDPQRALQSAAFPVLIATTVLRPHDWFARLLQLRPIEYLGRISYSVYLWRQLIFGMPPVLGFRYDTWTQKVVQTVIEVALILMLATASRRWIKEPMIAFGRKISHRFRRTVNVIETQQTYLA